jgi:hypothetical protein
MTAGNVFAGALNQAGFRPTGTVAIAEIDFIHEIRIRSGQSGGIRVCYLLPTSLERGAGCAGRQRSRCQELKASAIPTDQSVCSACVPAFAVACCRAVTEIGPHRLSLVACFNQIERIGSFVGATLVVARRAKSRGEAGGHKARPYAQRFRFNFEDGPD